MKKVKILSIFAAGLLIASCSGNNENKATNEATSEEAAQQVQEQTEEAPEQTPNVEIDKTLDVANVILPGKLKENIEVVSAEKSMSSFGYPQIDIQFKLLKTVDTKGFVGRTNQMWIVGEGQEENGKTVKTLLPRAGSEWRTGDSDGSQIKDFLENEPGETINMTFTGATSEDASETWAEGSDMPTEFAKVKKFKLSIKN